MTFADSIKTCFSKYADFKGRATRSEYWWFILFVFLVGMVSSMIYPMLAGVFYLATALPTLAAAVRRLHDTDRSGWFVLLGFIPLIGLVLLYFLVLEGKEPNRFGTASEASVTPAS